MIATITDFASQQQREFEAHTPAEARRASGHFGTPSDIAEFMAGMFSKIPHDAVRILDAGAGVGILTAAICRRLLRDGWKGTIVAELWEKDSKLEPYLRATLEQCASALRSGGIRLESQLHCADFIVAHGSESLFAPARTPAFDLAILNPPYYKLRKDSAEARAMEHVVHGQPNIYALFLAAAADLIVPGGELVAITPRSYFNGPYFKRFRTWFFDRMAVRQIHLFESRTEAFRENGVLQENVIMLAEKHGKPADVALTASVGRVLSDVRRKLVPYRQVIDDTTGDRVVRVLPSNAESSVVAAIDSLGARLHGLGLEVSTGPVVSFRAAQYLRELRGGDTAPLLWLHNVRPFVTRFPEKTKKPSHIEVSGGSKRLLLPARRYVLLKRFTAKEERRRLVAGIVEPADSYSEWLGLENHLNYIYRRTTELSRFEALGIAAYLNSRVVDCYFRAISGNTQVNATEIRALPFPDYDTLVAIGRSIQGVPATEEDEIERKLLTALKFPVEILADLPGGAR